MADIRQQLLAAFEVEYREHIDAIATAVERMQAGAGVNLREIFRRAHSLKGAARAVDLPKIEQAAHAMEALFADAMEAGAEKLDPAGSVQVRGYLDAVERETAAVYSRKTAVEVAAAEQPQAEYVRVNAGQVQRLSVAMYELSADLDRLEDDSQGLRELQARADALARVLEGKGGDRARLAQEARAVSRGLASLTRQHRDTSRASLNAAQRLREEIERVALVPAGTVFAGLDVMLRDLADEMGKRVDVRIDGLETQADRGLLQSLRDPVIHLLRNALAHGVEAPMERVAADKPEAGVVGLSVQARSGRLELTVFDDGRGPDLRRIEEAGEQRGLLPPRREGEASSVERLLALVFEPGFTTSGEVDRMAGRGMGLSVVAEAARRAGGGASMRRRYPAGTEVVISTPVSAARQPVLLAMEGGQVYGLPTRALERIVKAGEAEFEIVDARPMLKLHKDGNQILVPVVSLDGVLTGGPLNEESGLVNVAVLRQGDQRLGVRFDAFSDVRTATVVPLTHPAVDELVQGAVQLERDQVAVVINPEALMRRHARGGLAMTAERAPRPDARIERRMILVVDDSVTTRTLEKSILEANGYDVLLAVDGVDALNRLRLSVRPVDLIVADVEMPRMDGFGLLGALKADPQLARIPVIMMTSRAAPEDVRRGMDLGAEAYLVKQTFDQRDLLTTIGQLL